MGNIKAIWIVAAVAVILLLCAFALFVQKGSVQVKYDKLQARLERLVTSEYTLKQELDESNSKLLELNKEKQALSEEVETLKKMASNLKESQLQVPTVPVTE